MAPKKGLGKGLESLFNENATDSEGAVIVPLVDIEPNRDQPRKDFDEAAISELAASIETHGLIQPIVVKPTANGRYSIIAGERRWRACRLAGLTEVPVVIRDGDEKALMELALVENLQREDLNAVEEAQGYRVLIETYGMTQEQVATQVGKSRSTVTNALRLLNLTEAELEALRMGEITAGHARALLACEDENKRQRMLFAALNGASVRELERMAAQKSTKTVKPASPKNKFYLEAELSLKEALHRKVQIAPGRKKGRGTLTIEFYSDEELSDFAKRLSGE